MILSSYDFIFSSCVLNIIFVESAGSNIEKQKYIPIFGFHFNPH